MKKLVVISALIYAQAGAFSQVKLKTENAYGLYRNGVYSPLQFMGNISDNNSTNGFKLDLKEEKFSMSGVILEDTLHQLSMNIGGEVENDMADLFENSTITPKVLIDLNYTRNLWTVAFYTPQGNKSELDNISDENKFDTIVKYGEKFGLNSIHSLLFSAGLNFEGARYNMIDTTLNYSEVIQKKEFTGWKVFGQLSYLNYSTKNQWSNLVSLKLYHGEVNNVADLDEYTISTTATVSNTINKRSFDRKSTGYYTYDYQKLHRFGTSLEWNFLNLNTDITRLGYIAGVDFLHFFETDESFFVLNGGLVVNAFNKEEKRPTYIALILSSQNPQDIFNTSKNVGFMDTFSASLRLGMPFNFKGLKQSDDEADR